MWRALISIVLGLLLVTIGLVLALDYRGVATKHIALAMSAVHPLTPSRKLEWQDERLVERRRRFVLLDRLVGVLIVPAGLVMLVAGGQHLLRG
ncbi:hypothetical protein ACQPZK_10245 [Micromonospora sp. CA-249363]|uniref:hypothetical protein n=1 Tax=Micromonospora sp. CA-249363 TaxID=3239963 RepID=UPI003D8B21B1